MNIIGKIFLFAVFIMSLVLMTFAGAIYFSHINWKDEIFREPTACLPGQQPGYKHQLEAAEKDRESLEAQINRLQQRVAESEQARDQVVAKLQSAIVQKDKELTGLRAEKEAREEDQRQKVALLDKTTKDLEEARAKVDLLTKQVAEQQARVDIDSDPTSLVPTLDGRVIAVASGAIEVSLGSDDGLRVEHVLEVYRDDEYVGRAVVTSVQPDRAVARLVKEYVRGVVQRGDRVTTRLKA